MSTSENAAWPRAFVVDLNCMSASMTRPSFEGIHHLKFAVSDLNRSLDFYERALGAKRIDAFDHYDKSGTLYAYILDVPDLGTHLELRLDPHLAARHGGFDPITLQVADRANLAAWIAHFDANDVPHSPMLPAYVAWIVVFEDPDGRRIRLYTREMHGPDVAPSEDARWL